MRFGAEHGQSAFAAQFAEKRAYDIEYALARSQGFDLCTGCGHKTPEGYQREATTQSPE